MATGLTTEFTRYFQGADGSTFRNHIIFRCAVEQLEDGTFVNVDARGRPLGVLHPEGLPPELDSWVFINVTNDPTGLADRFDAEAVEVSSVDGKDIYGDFGTYLVKVVSPQSTFWDYFSFPILPGYVPLTREDFLALEAVEAAARQAVRDQIAYDAIHGPS